MDARNRENDRPAPPHTPSQGSPRQRTTRTMERLLAAAAASAMIAGCSSKGGSGSGYAVVDPMPPPARCPGVATSIDVTAAWKQGQGGLVVELRLSKPRRPDASYAPAEAPAVSSGKLVSSNAEAGAMALEIAPEPGVTSVYVSVGATCSDGSSHVAIELDLSGAATTPPKAGDPVKLTMNDSY